jgi:stage V sporulation protein B
MAMPLIYFPSVFLISLSVSLVPEVAQSCVTKNKIEISRSISKIILFTTIIGVGAAIFFIIFSNDIGAIIYHEDISDMLQWLGIMCPFLYLQIILSGILNGMDHQTFLFKVNLLSSFISLLFIYFLIPQKGILAFIAGWFISLIISNLLSLNIITKDININLEFNQLILKPIISSIAAGLITKFIANRFIMATNKNLLNLFVCASMLEIIYLIFIVITGAMSINDLMRLLKVTRKRSTQNQIATK